MSLKIYIFLNKYFEIFFARACARAFLYIYMYIITGEKDLDTWTVFLS